MNATVLLLFLLLLQRTAPVKSSPRFHWDWHQQQNLFKAKSLRDIEPDGPDRQAIAKAIGGKAALDENVELINLSQDGSPAVVVQEHDSCSGDGNCELSFFQKTAHGYKLLLDAIGEGFVVQKTTTNGFNDLVVNMHSSATDQWLKVYRYARGRYWRAACYDANWAPLGKDGEVHELKEPRITPEPCG